MTRMSLQTFSFWHNHFLLHSITLHPSSCPYSQCAAPQDFRCETTFSFYCLHFEDEDWRLHQNVCAVSRHEVIKPQKIRHTLDIGHKNLQMRIVHYTLS